MAEETKLKKLEDLIYNFSDEIPYDLCPMCKLEVITDYDICRWLEIDKDIKEKILKDIKDIKEKFNNYENFKQYLRDNHENS